VRAIWSVHDVSPTTIELAAAIVERLEARKRGPIWILIVPAGEWPAAALAQLRCWAATGHELVLHGWAHEAPAVHGLYHRLHSALLSRDAAEHLGRDEADIRALVEAGRAWFAANGLPAPRVYVPPAWAMGALPLRAMGRYGFDRVETLSGIWDARHGRGWRLPLIGFEADTRFRAVSLRTLNAANVALARLSGRPLRIAIHPFDPELFLGPDLARWLERAPAVHPAAILSARPAESGPSS
jgi:predicted deacetylase